MRGSEWGPAGGGDVFVRFGDGGQLTGFASCNSFGGRFVDKRYALEIGPIWATRKACARQVMTREQEFLNALTAMRTVSGGHLKLMLKDADGNDLMELHRRDWD